MSTTILVSGATGRQGQATIDALLLDRKPNLIIRALVRSKDSPAAGALEAKGVELVVGTFDDQTSLATALQGVTSAYLMTTRTVSGSLTTEETNGKAFIDAASSAGVSHIVYSSVEGADETTLIPHYVHKYAIERHLQKSGMRWTIIRPAGFYDNFPKVKGFKTGLILGLFDVPLRGKEYQFVAIRDIGWFAARALQVPDRYSNRIIKLAGENLSIPSAQAAYSSVFGGGPQRKVWFPQLTMSMLPENEKGMFERMMESAGPGGADVDALRREHPGLLTFEDWLASDELPSPIVLRLDSCSRGAVVALVLV